MSTKIILVGGLLSLIILAGGREAAAQSCRFDANQELFSTIISKYRRREAPDNNFKYGAQERDLGGLRQLGFEVLPLRDPYREPDLVSYPYSVTREHHGWRLHISMIGKYAVLQNLGPNDGDISGPVTTRNDLLPLPWRPSRPIIDLTQQIIDWLRGDGYKVLDRNVLSCPTRFPGPGSGQVNNATGIYWQVLFRWNSPIPTTPRRQQAPSGRHR